MGKDKLSILQIDEELEDLHAQAENLLQDAEPIEDVLTEQSVDTQPVPTDPNWTDYVLSLMNADELLNGCPRADGLRRMVELLVGPIQQIIPDVLQCPSPDNQYHATVKVNVIVNNQAFGGCADVGPNNTDNKYAIHPVATAETKAEGRAYRKVLRLRNIITAEENIATDETEPSTKIKPEQIRFIDGLCSKLNINVVQWLHSHDLDLDKFNHITSVKARDLCSELNDKHQSGEIEESILGYNSNWR